MITAVLFTITKKWNQCKSLINGWMDNINIYGHSHHHGGWSGGCYIEWNNPGTEKKIMTWFTYEH